MGNSESPPKEDIKQLTFEENKKEYFSYVRKNFQENVKEIATTLNTSSSKSNDSTLNLSENNEDPNAWQHFLIMRLANYKPRMNQSSISYIEDVIDYVEKLTDTNENQVFKLNLFLSNEMDESRNKLFLISKEEEKNGSASPSKNAIILRSIDFIFENMDKIDHPLNKVVKNVNFNFSLKYEKELLELYKNEENKNRESENKLDEEAILRSKTVSIKNKDKSKESINNKRSLINIPKEELTNFYNYVKDELTNISFILILTIIKFYKIMEAPELKIIDILGEKIKDLIIAGDMLRFLQKIKLELRKDTILKYQEKFLEYYNIMPQDLGLSPYFSFDNSFREKIAFKIDQKSYGIDNKFSDIPYFRSIIYLRDINKAHSIIKKLEIMLSLRDVILKEIDCFWTGFYVNQKKRYVDADNLLSIFIYLVIKSQLVDLIIDIEIIDDFISKSLKLSRKGYFFSLVQSSFEYLLNTMSPAQIEINRKEFHALLENEYRQLESNIVAIIDTSQSK